MLAILPYKVVFSINRLWGWGKRLGRVNYHLKNVCKRPSVATAPVLVDLLLLCCTLINKTHTRPYKLPRVRPDAARLLEGEPYQEWQWASFLHTSCLRPCCLPSGLAWDAHAVAQSGCNLSRSGASPRQLKMEGRRYGTWESNPLYPAHLLPLAQAPKP